MRPNARFFDGFIESLIQYRRLVFSLVLLFIAVGYLALSTMARQEDPSFPYRMGLVKVFYPGGTPLQIEKLITEPLEEELAQVAEIEDVESTSRDDLAIFNLFLKDYVYDTDSAWDRVQAAIERARLQFPRGVNRIEFDDRRIDMPAAVLSVTGSNDPILLEEAALKLKTSILSLSGVSRIEIEGAPAKEVIVKLDQDSINRLGVSRQMVANVIAQRNQIIPGGLVSSEDKNIRLNTQSDFASLNELRRTSIPLPSGQVVSLETIAEVKLEPRLPLASQAFQDGQRAISLGIIAQRGQVDIVKFGKQLRNKIEAFRPVLAPLKIQESFFQPDYVQDRLDGLRGNLIISVLIIALIVFLAMGWRTGALVSLVLPVVSMITIGLYSVGGGVFHQMAVIGMVISLGILIDNAIVVIEYIESAIRKGVQLEQAIRDSIKVMAKPLMASTGTTIAAFIPLLLAKGGVGDFTRAVPTMIVIALLVSYVISVLVLPLVAYYWLQNKPANSGLAFQFTDKLANRCASLVEAGPKRVLLVVALMLSVSVALTPFLKQEFFPSTDRAQIIVDIVMPSNTPLDETEKVSKELEQQLLSKEGVDTVYRYVGGAGFRFYYNMGGAPNESHVARLTVNTRKTADNQRVVDWVREELKPLYPDVTLVPRLLGQGPPRPAPIELLVKHNDLAALHDASQLVKALLLQTPGVTELRSNLDLGTSELQLSIQDNAALSFGLQPEQVASAVFAESRGLDAGQFRYDTDPVPIRVRSSDGQRSSVEVIENQFIYGANSQNSTAQQKQGTPLNQVAALQATWQPTTLRHHNFERSVSVLAQIKPGYAFNQILASFNKKLAEADLPGGVKIEYGGDAAASSEANSNIATAAPLALGLLIFFMMLQFNSFRRISIVFITIPLAGVGVIPGLVLSGQPFGFQSLLGVIALIGIVVNNAIVLIDVVDQSLKKGKSVDVSVRQALEQRTAPILITTATTILGLLPLALSSSTLWPPMAWAIISGLLLSTTLTLVAIPALCTLILDWRLNRIAPIRVSPSIAMIFLTLALSVGFVSTDKAIAQDFETQTLVLDTNTIIARAKENAGFVATQNQVEAAEFEYQSQRRKAWAPKLSIGGELSRRSDDTFIELPQPFGDVVVSEDSSYVINTKISQPLFNLGAQRYDTKVARLERDSSQLRSNASLHQITGGAINAYLEALSLQNVRASLTALDSSLNARIERTQKEFNAGRVLKTDLLQVQVAANRVKQQLVVNQNQLATIEASLKNRLSIPKTSNLEYAPLDRPLSKSDSTDRITALQCFERQDCLAVERSIEILDTQAKSVGATTLPTINLSLSDQRSEGLLFVAEDDQRALLEFAWPIFAGGQLRSKKKAIKSQAQAATNQLLELQRNIQVEIQQAEALRRNAVSAIEFAKQSLQLDIERLELSRKRYDAGRLNIDELLDAEASLAQSKTDLALAEIQLAQAWVAGKLAKGEVF